MIDERFSRASFLAAADAKPLCDDLARVIADRLRAADDYGDEESIVIEDLVGLGHPMRLFDQNVASDEHGGEYWGSTWCDDWENAKGTAGDLIVETFYPDRPGAGDPAKIRVDVTFQREKPKKKA